MRGEKSDAGGPEKQVIFFCVALIDDFDSG
jgi:hypothetical protein